MTIFSRLFALLIAAAAPVAASTVDWVYVGSKYSKPMRMLIFFDPASVVPKADGLIEADWSSYWETDPTHGAVPNNRWTINHVAINCANTTYRDLTAKKMRESDASVAYEKTPDSKAFGAPSAGFPMSLVIDIVCRRQAVATLSLKGIAIPQAAAMLFPQLP